MFTRDHTFLSATKYEPCLSLLPATRYHRPLIGTHCDYHRQTARLVVHWDTNWVWQLIWYHYTNQHHVSTVVSLNSMPAEIVSPSVNCAIAVHGCRNSTVIYCWPHASETSTYQVSKQRSTCAAGELEEAWQENSELESSVSGTPTLQSETTTLLQIHTTNLSLLLSHSI